MNRFEKVSFGRFAEDLRKNSSATYSDDEIRDIYKQIKLPIRATEKSAGYDFAAPVASAPPCVIPTGIRVKINDGFFLALFPRSGLGFKYGLRLSNTVGIIDGDYYDSDNEGHILVSVKSEKPLDIDAGMRFCQGIFIPFGVVDGDDTKTKRNGGFGST
ncbi:MAG: deoxyuridine 5'-triphosphate nucleotidohydrolase [Ruminococcus sp.]|nr:deoxyuridine 5'-triphosphate nucleotidohydrolase [Ruminococcus sp.]